MSKAMLVLDDMPKSCAKRPLITRYGQEYICPPTKCDINGMDAPLARMRFCPLRPLPEPACVYLDEGYTPMYNNWEAGWDELLELIGGWEEEDERMD